MDFDLQEQTRRDDSYKDINNILDSLNKLSISPSILWLYIWDTVKYKLDYYSEDQGESLIVNPALNEKQVWDILWDSEGFTWEYGTEQLDEQIFDWMLDNNILVDVESETEEE